MTPKWEVVARCPGGQGDLSSAGRGELRRQLVNELRPAGMKSAYIRIDAGFRSFDARTGKARASGTT